MAREIDDVQKRKIYKEKKFGDKKSVIDAYTGERIFKGNSRDSNYKHPTDKTTDIDHITPIDVVEKRYGHLPKEQQQKLANREYNYAVTNSKLNRSKGKLENHEYLLKKLKKGEPENLKTSLNMLKKEVFDSSIPMNLEASAMMVENTLEKNAVQLTARAVDNVIKMAQGEVTLDEAAKDMGEKTGVLLVKEYAESKILEQMSKSKSELLKNISKNNQISQIISVAVIVKDSAVKYIEGEIDEKEFISEVGTQAVVTTVGSMIGQAIGTAIFPGIGTVAGEILGTIITTVACSAIVSVYNTNKHLDDYKKKEQQIRRLEREALKEMENQRNKFKSIVASEYEYWDKEIKEGFDMIVANACEETFNIEGVTDGLDKILALFGKKVTFKSLEEYEAQLDMPLKLRF